ncbi:MAG: metal ABC transporter permease [Bdellovibrionales bacterium]
MIEYLLEPFQYQYMVKAMLACMIVGATCAFLSSYLMLKGWSLMGDALAHAIVPGVALAYVLSLPYAVGAFFTGLLASFSMSIVKQKTKLREDAVIGLIFTSFLSIGLIIISIYPTSVNLNAIILGNILTIPNEDLWQVTIISVVCLSILTLKWKDLKAIFFDENHAQSIGISVNKQKILFFTLLSAACVAALQTVGACLVIAMLITPGATAYLLTDKFGKLIILAIILGSTTSMLGAYLSFFINTNPGGIIVCLQTLIFLIAYMFAPKYGTLSQARIQKRHGNHG